MSERESFIKRSSALKENAGLENSTDHTIVCNQCQTNNLQRKFHNDDEKAICQDVR